MCGIAGLIDFSNNNKINLPLLKKMSDIIAHRGPDDDGHWIAPSNECGLAFRRLSIIDLSPAGHQPMLTDDGKTAIVFNGEIYNYLDLRKELIGKGYTFKSRTDTETILYGYKEYGRAIVDRIEGMFAFAIWDDDRKELFAARDRAGKKPFYYAQFDNKLIFASEIKSILQHPDVKAALNINELPNYLNYGTSSFSSTLFKGINKLTNGHRLIFNRKHGLKIERYWTPVLNNLPYTNLDENEIFEQVLFLLKNSIKNRMMSDVPFGVFLSGGVDSSLNVALMAELMDRPVDTFTVGFKELEKYNELDYAHQIAVQYKTNHREILIDHNDAFGILEDLPWYEDEPNADPVCIPLYFLCKMTRQSGTIVIQVGEGSDEQFIGYSNMLRDYNFYKNYWTKFIKLPESVRRTIYYATRPFFLGAKQPLALDYLRRGAFGQELYWGGNSIFSPTHLNYMLEKEYNGMMDIPAKLASLIHSDCLAQKPDADYLQRMTYIELAQRLPELLLMRIDKIGMANSIETRAPFLDYNLIEFIISVAPQIKMPNSKMTKYILKKAVEPILPHNIIYRKKQGFWAPVNEWFKSYWYDYSSDKILNSYFIKNNILNKEYIQNLMLTHKKEPKSKAGFKIYTLLMLSLWAERFGIE